MKLENLLQHYAKRIRGGDTGSPCKPSELLPSQDEAVTPVKTKGKVKKQYKKGEEKLKTSLSGIEVQDEETKQPTIHHVKNSHGIDNMLRTILSRIAKKAEISIDLETTGLNPLSDNIRVIGLGYDDTVYLMDMAKIESIPPKIVEILEDREVSKILHNSKFDCKFLKAKYGINTDSIWDTMLAEIIRENGRVPVFTKNYFRLEDMVRRYFRVQLNKDEELRCSFRETGELNQNQILYAAQDVCWTYKLKEVLTQKIEEEKLSNVVALEGNLVSAIVEMELKGFHLNKEKFNKYHQYISEELIKIKEEIKKIAGDFNPNSQPQILETFKSKYNKNLESTGAASLKRIKGQGSNLAKTLMEYRKIHKLKSTYMNTFIDHVGPDDRIRSTYNQLGAKTGRLSSSGPNLQNIPNDRNIRECFCAEKGSRLIMADYGQIELRVCAEITGDKNLLDAFNNDEDIHTLTASFILNKPKQKITKDERQASKAVNFGLVFGMQPKGLQEHAKNKFNVDIDMKTAINFRRKFFEAYSGIQKWQGREWREVEGSKKSYTKMGRLRYLADPYPQLVYNNPIQGTAADGMKESLILLNRQLNGHNAKLINCVHDDVIIEVKESEVEEVKKIVEKSMIEGMSRHITKVPVEVDISVCDSWADK